MSLRNDKGSPPARIISPNNCSCSKSLSIVSTNITTWQYTNMRDGLVANIDLANDNKESYAYMSNGLVADRLSHACPTSPSCRSYRAGVLLSGEDTLQKIITM